MVTVAIVSDNIVDDNVYWDGVVERSAAVRHAILWVCEMAMKSREQRHRRRRRDVRGRYHVLSGVVAAKVMINPWTR